MTADEIQALSDPGLHDAIVAVLGREGLDTESTGWGIRAVIVPQSLDACHAAEERLKEMGLATAFTVQLYLVAVEAQKADGRRHPIRWYEVHATARERAEAIYAAVQERENE